MAYLEKADTHKVRAASWIGCDLCVNSRVKNEFRTSKEGCRLSDGIFESDSDVRSATVMSVCSQLVSSELLEARGNTTKGKPELVLVNNECKEHRRNTTKGYVCWLIPSDISYIYVVKCNEC